MTTHETPCTELIRQGQELHNSIDWQGRIEGRVNWILYTAIGSLITALLSTFGIIVTLVVTILVKK